MSEERDSCVQEFAAYHVVTSRPMQVGQRIHFDRAHPNGVFHRVKEKEEDVRQIKAHPEEWREKELPHHTMVALRELALEEVRMSPNRWSRRKNGPGGLSIGGVRSCRL